MQLELGLFGIKLTGNALSFEVPAPSFERMVGNTDEAYAVVSPGSFVRVARDSLRAAARPSWADVRYGDCSSKCVRRQRSMQKDRTLRGRTGRGLPREFKEQVPAV